VSLFFADNHSLYFEHMLIARNLLEGKGYSWDEWGRAALQSSSMIPPLYVYWCAFFQWLSPANFLPMYLGQAVIAATGCFPAYRLGKRLFSERAGLLFAACYAFYPELVFIHSKAVAESIYVVMVLWMIERYAALREEPPGSRRAVKIAVFVGALSGTAMLVKEAAGIVAIAIVLALLLRFRARITAIRSHMLPALAAMALVMCPWIVRNAIVQGEFIPIRTAFGINWWVANHPGAAGNDRYADGTYVMSSLPKDYADYLNRILPFDEQDRDRVYAEEVLRFIRQHPSEYLALCGKRFVYWIWFVSGHQLAKNPVYRASWIALLALSIPGLVCAARRHLLDPVFSLSLLGYMLLYVPTTVLPRYRVVTTTILLLFAAVAIDGIARYVEARSKASALSSPPPA
jgi:4-amino-4-deoxy-L-arabinose transferase-like glycosyltransferase